LVDLGEEFDRAAKRRLGQGARRRRRVSFGGVVAGLGALAAIALGAAAIALLSHRTQHPSSPAPATQLGKHKGGAVGTPAARKAAIRARLLRQETQAKHRVTRTIIQNFAFFAPGARLGRFGHGANAFTVSQPPFSSLPTFVLQLAAEGLPYDPRAAREVSTPSGLHIWIVPGNGICMLDPPSGGGDCSGSLALALQEGVLHKQTAADGMAIYVGIAPNTNATVTAKTVTGRTRTVPVIDNLFITPAAGLPSGPPNFHIKPAS
jgi:hypothetical protein